MIANSEDVTCIEIQQVREFVDKKPTDKILGYAYNCICYANGYAQLKVVIDGKKPDIDPEAIKEYPHGLLISFEGFSAKIIPDYNNNKEMRVIANATKAIIVREVTI